MKCEKCGSEWTSQINLNDTMKCPFCNAPLSPIKENEITGIKSALKWIVETKGIESFKNAGLINGMLADLVKGQEADKRKIRIALSSGAGTAFYDTLTRNNGSFRDSDVKLFLTSLEECGLASDFSCYILNTFLFATSLPEVSIKPSSLDEKPLPKEENGESVSSGERQISSRSIDLIIILLCGAFLGFGIYAIHHFVNDRTITFMGIEFNTWIKQYFVWCLTYVCAAIAGGIIVTRMIPKRKKTYIKVCMVLVTLGVLWPTLLGSPGLISSISYGDEPVFFTPGQEIRPYIKPLLCSKSTLLVNYSSEDRLDIKNGNKVFASEDSTAFFQKGIITAKLPFREDKSIAIVLDNTINYEGYKNHFNTGELVIDYTLSNETIQNWDFFFKMKNENNERFTMTSFTIDIYSNDNKWHNICDFHGEYDSESDDNMFYYYNKKLDKPVEGATKARATFKYKGITDKDVVYWDSLYAY